MFKRFLGYYKPHLKLFAVDMLAALTVAACGLVYPAIAREIINNYAPNRMVKSILIASAILLGVYLIKALCNYVVAYYGHVVGVRMQGDMRRDLFRKYQSLPFSYFDNNKTGELLSRLVSDLQDVAELAHHGPENLFLASLMFIGSFAILSSIDLALTLIMFSIVPFIILFTCLCRRRMRAAMKASRVEMAVINADAECSITGIRETKSYAASGHEIRKFNTSNKRFISVRSEAMRALGSFDSVMHLLTDLLYLVVILAGGLFLYYGRIDGGDFTMFILYISFFLDPIRRFVNLFQQLQEGMSGFARFHEIMLLPEECDEGEEEISELRGEIVFDDVTFRYGEDEGTRAVLSHLDLTVGAGRTLALVGPSGGGKTTLCHLIPRFYNVTEGRITLDGVDIMDIKLSSLRENIGIVSQNVFLFDGTVRDNIAYGNLDATEEEIVEAAKRASIHDYIMTLKDGYDTEVGERGIRLSGGQRQRIAIARVFLKNPKLLILDEATSALDNTTEIEIQNALEELSAGRTVIVVAHRLSTVKRADEIVVLDENGIAERGTHEELIARGGIYKTLYTYQFRE